MRGEAWGLGFLIFIATIAGCFMIDSWQCGRRWANSGMATSWGPIQGCQVEVRHGVFFPENRVRGVQDE